MTHRLTYAIGDIHGRLDLLQQALQLIEGDAGQRGAEIVFLGDYVDRGHDSRGVIDLLSGGPGRICDRYVCLMGNHEDMMLQAAGGREPHLSHWLDNGGDATLASYAGAIPVEHLRWLQALPRLYEGEHQLFVHAGLMPGYALAEQKDEWLVWIRERFLCAAPQWDKHIVHGHTPQWSGKPDPTQPEQLAHRTNLDTMAYASGILTVGVFEGPGGPKRLLRVCQSGRASNAW